MAKIIIPKRNLEVEVDEGELVLLLNGDRIDESGKVDSAIIGVFSGIEKIDNSHKREKYNSKSYQDKSFILVLNGYILKPCGKMGGLDITCSEPWKNTSLMICKDIKQIYSPQEQIVQALQSWPGFEAHAEWVTRLKKPYLE